MSIPDPNLRYRLLLVDDALEQMADAMGPEARHPNGQPKKVILLGDKKRGIARVLDRTHQPTSEIVATVSARHAAAAEIDFWDAMRALWKPIPVSDDVTETVAA